MFPVHHSFVKEKDVNGLKVTKVRLKREYVQDFFEFGILDEEETRVCYFDADFYVIFDTNKIERGSCVTMEVPKGKEGIFIGTKGWQVKEWCKMLDVQRINVIGV